MAGGLLGTLLGLLGVSAWLFDRLLLASLGLHYIPMAPSTGVAFTLLGASLVLAVRADRRAPSRSWHRLLAVGVAAFGLIELVNFAGALPRIDLEALLVRNPAWGGRETGPGATGP
jgi:hypothetical protein